MHLPIEVFTHNKFTRRGLLSALSLFPAARLLSAQQSPAAEQAPKYSTDVKLVNLFATVRDKSGKIVKDLTKDNFQLDEEGRGQTIKFFERESSLPPVSYTHLDVYKRQAPARVAHQVQDFTREA